ncbi:MAG TPA: hypothetical protein VJ787_14090, partial [Thermoleophilia bacterium]|nr:hypothetical protein [Thermoleophilia bacterium]
EQGARLLLEKETLVREELPALKELKPAIAAAARVRSDNQGERAASIRMRMRRGWTDGGRA